MIDIMLQNKQSSEVFLSTTYQLSKNKQILHDHVCWLSDLLAQGKDIDGPVGVIGTIISATWLKTELGEKVSSFVDEDQNRIRRLHLGLPTFSISECPEDVPILMPLLPDIARCIVRRHACRCQIRLIIPPANRGHIHV